MTRQELRRAATLLERHASELKAGVVPPGGRWPKDTDLDREDAGAKDDYMESRALARKLRPVAAARDALVGRVLEKRG